MALQFNASQPLAIGTSGGTSAVFGLASSTTSFAQSDVVTTSTTANITDIQVQVDILMPAHTPSTSTTINFFAFATEDSTTYPGGSATNEVLGATAGLVTISANGNNLKFLGSMIAHTASITMKSQPMSVVSALGVVPRKWGIVVQNQCGTTLPTTGHTASYTEVYYN